MSELYVVELDDPNMFPTPTWGPFDTAALAEAWAHQQVGSTGCEITEPSLGPILRSYALDDGRYYYIKRLTSP